MILGRFNRYVVSWELSMALAADFCVPALERALRSARPEIFNSDQEYQFTSEDLTDRLERSGVRISVDGRERGFDNIFVPRLWRMVKYEEVCLIDCEDGRESARGLGAYLEFHNDDRAHQALGYQTPAEV